MLQPTFWLLFAFLCEECVAPDLRTCLLWTWALIIPTIIPPVRSTQPSLHLPISREIFRQFSKKLGALLNCFPSVYVCVRTFIHSACRVNYFFCWLAAVLSSHFLSFFQPPVWRYRNTVSTLKSYPPFLAFFVDSLLSHSRTYVYVGISPLLHKVHATLWFLIIGKL